MVFLKVLKMRFCPSSRLLSCRATGALVAAMLAVGCATPGSSELRANTAVPATVAPVMVSGPGADQFLGRSVARLDQMIGTPALIRQEGEGEFRRYDLGPCRAYAVVARGVVTALSTGPAVVGAPALPFEECTAAR